MSTIVAKKLNLPLPQDMHEAIFSESRRLGISAARLVRTVLEDWLQERRREIRREEVRRFALEHAGTDLDLDPALEAAAVEELRLFYGEEDEARAGWLPKTGRPRRSAPGRVLSGA